MTSTIENVLLHDEWIATNGSYSQLASWIACGDRIVAAANHLVFCTNMYTGEDASNGILPYHLSDPAGAPCFAYANGIVYFNDGTQLLAVDLVSGSTPSAWSPALSANTITSLQVIDGVLVIAYTGAQGQTCVTGLDPLAGSSLWNLSNVTQQSPGLIGLGDQAAFFVVANQLLAINVGSGVTRFTGSAAQNATLDQSRPPLVIGTTVICGGNGVYAFDYRKGTLLWSALAGTPGCNATYYDEKQIIVANGSALSAVALATGATLWSQTIDTQLAPMTIGNVAYTLDPMNASLSSYQLDNAGAAGEVFTLGSAAAGTPIIANGTLFVPGNDDALHAMPFADQDGAYFDGAHTYFTIQPANSDFDFSLNDFTIEVWVRSSEGGEVLSSYPKTAGYGLRLNLAVDGTLQFAIADAAGANADLWATDATNASDGTWHHIAVVRSRGTVTLFLDGIGLKTKHAYRRNGAKANPYYFEQASLCAPLELTGGNALVGGAFQASTDASRSDFFTGLMRELRIWTRALDGTKIASRMHQELNFLTADLLGNWHLGDDWATAASPQTQSLSNDVQGFDFVGTCYNAWSCVTDFILDESNYPFSLEKAPLAWPYQSSAHWAVCGENAVSGTVAPLIGAGGVVCFSDSGATYGVAKLDGKRCWGIQMPEAFSPPCVDGSAFLILTEQFGMLSIDCVSGEYDSISAFNSVVPQDYDHSTPLVRPATTKKYRTAVGPDGTLWVQARATMANAMSVMTAPKPSALQTVGDVAAVYAEQAIYLVNLSSQGATIGWTVPADSNIFYLDAQRLICVQNGCIACIDLNATSSAVWYASQPVSGTVSGMAASADGSTLVVTTDAGIAYGYSIGNLATRWMDDQAVAASAYFAPAFGSGYVAATASNGTVVAFDPMTGDMLAQYKEPHAIVTAPAVDLDTLYYGCAKTGDDQLFDGALHSVALGGTCALRLGITSASPAYAAIASNNPLSLYAADEMSLEAWVNTDKIGGDVITVLPSNADKSFFTNLNVGADGTISFAYASTTGGLALKTGATNAGEGQWHHIAVCMNGASDVRVYLDSQKLDATMSAAPAMPAAVAGTSIFLGAGSVDTSGNPQSFYNGMLADVRLWDDYLTVAEISARENEKLVGDEPDLIAYWNFDARMIHDSARNGFDGTLVGENVSADYWLTALPLAPTSYPTMGTSAVMKAQDANSTTYLLTVKTAAADQTPLAGSKLVFWFMSTDAAATIQVGQGATMSTLRAQAPGRDSDPANGFACVTDATGSLTLTVVTTDTSAGPSLNVNADFMYPNERFHLNTLVNNQNFTKPPTPQLIVQTKNQEDYGYVHGDDLSDGSHRDTFQVIVKAVNSDMSPMINEAVSIWCDDSIIIEINGTSYNIGTANSADVVTDASGEVPIIIGATDIHCAELSLWAGFMARDARIKVAPDQDGQNQLAQIQGGDLTASHPQQWTPETGACNPSTPILTGDYASHSSDISETMRHLMAAGQGSSSTTGEAALRSLRAARPPRLRTNRFPDMKQPAPYFTADVAPRRLTPVHIDRVAPLTPEFLLHSLLGARQPGEAVPTGFHFKWTGSIETFTFNHIHSLEEFDAIRSSGPTRTVAARPILGNFWDDIVDAADDVWDDVKEVAIQVGDTVTAAINTAEGWVTTAIDDIKTACLAIGNLLKQLAIELIDIIKFLLSFFDWGAILATADRLRSLHGDMTDQLKSYLNAQDLGNGAANAIKWLKGEIDSLVGVSMSVDSISQARVLAPNPNPSGTDGVQTKYTQKKLAQYGPQSDFSLLQDSGDDLSSDFAALAASMVDSIANFLTAIPNVASMSLSDFIHLLETTIFTPLNALLDLIADLLGAIVSSAVKLVDGAIDGMETPIDIPFLSALYKWITGGQSLTYGIIASIAAAVPLNVMSELFYQESFTSLAPSSLPPLFSSSLESTSLRAGDSDAMKQVYMIAGILNAPLQSVIDVLATNRWSAWNGGDSMEAPSAPEYLCNITSSLLGAVTGYCDEDSPGELRAAVYLIQVCKALYNLKGLNEGNQYSSVAWYDKAMPFAIMAVGMASIVLTFTLSKDESDTEKAASVLNAVPLIDRPALLFGKGNEILTAVVALTDFACISTAATMVGTS